MNGKSWFEIQSPEFMVEYQQLGSRWMRYEVTSEKMPDRVFIQDVIDLLDERWVPVEPDAFAAFLATVEKKP